MTDCVTWKFFWKKIYLLAIAKFKVKTDATNNIEDKPHGCSKCALRQFQCFCLGVEQKYYKAQ